MKHAYLIIAHNEFELLNKLIYLLDDECHDIYIHIDLKSSSSGINGLNYVAKYSKVKVFKQIAITWGHESQVYCQMLLLKEAISTGQYDYFHFLSGTDLPIKSNKYIQKFFYDNRGKEFIHFDRNIPTQKDKDRINVYHYLSRYYKKYNNKILNKLIFKLDDGIVGLQKILKFNKYPESVHIQKGCNWVSITNTLGRYLLDHIEEIKFMVKNSKCADEIFIQTLVENSNFKNNLYYKGYDNNYEACMRLIIWEGKHSNSPKILNEDDVELLKKSKLLFARKFSFAKHEKFVNEWVQYIANLNDKNK